MAKVFLHSVIVALLTVVTQIGGVAWLLALCLRRRLLAFALFYTVISASTMFLAPSFGRVPLPCIAGDGPKMQSMMYCALNRQYVVPELEAVLADYDAHMKLAFPGTVTNILDANFPFVTGFPLLPHLSHDDGRKVDLAFYYVDQTGEQTNSRSPIGYFAFEEGASNCPPAKVTLRWDMAWLQGVWPKYELDAPRMTAALQWLGAEDRIGKAFIEPHLKARFDPQNSKLRFQGCRAARHDDHIHIQL